MFIFFCRDNLKLFLPSIRNYSLRNLRMSSSTNSPSKDTSKEDNKKNDSGDEKEVESFKNDEKKEDSQIGMKPFDCRFQKQMFVNLFLFLFSSDSLSNLLKLFGFRTKPERREKVLKSLDLTSFAEHLKSSKKIIFMNGAGKTLFLIMEILFKAIQVTNCFLVILRYKHKCGHTRFS